MTIIDPRRRLSISNPVAARIGQQGRRTGITVRHDVAMDDDGMENVEAFFDHSAIDAEDSNERTIDSSKNLDAGDENKNKGEAVAQSGRNAKQSLTKRTPVKTGMENVAHTSNRKDFPNIIPALKCYT